MGAMAMGKSKTRGEFEEEWRGAMEERHKKVRRRQKPARMLEAEEHDAADQSHLRDTVLHFAHLGRLRLGKHYHPSLVAVPLLTLLRALERDGGPR